MRAKELKQFLSKLPDDTEILIRCQVHERPPMGAKETVNVASITPHFNDTTHQIVFNPERLTRLTSFQPNPTDLVVCTDCVRAARIAVCQKRGRVCEECKATCECKECGHFNIEMDEPFQVRPHYEKDPYKKEKKD